MNANKGANNSVSERVAVSSTFYSVQCIVDMCTTMKYIVFLGHPNTRASYYVLCLLLLVSMLSCDLYLPPVILSKCGQHISDSEIEEMIGVADTDKDGKINYKGRLSTVHTKPRGTSSGDYVRYGELYLLFRNNFQWTFSRNASI